MYLSYKYFYIKYFYSLTIYLVMVDTIHVCSTDSKKSDSSTPLTLNE